MSLTTQLWRGAGFLILGGALLSGVSAFGAEDPPLSTQLADLGRQALAQGAAPMARTFFQKALQLDPNNKAAARGPRADQARRPIRSYGSPCRIRPRPRRPSPHAGSGGRRPADASRPADTQATLEQTQAAETLSRQQLTNDVDQRLEAARQLMNSGPARDGLECPAHHPERRPFQPQRPRSRPPEARTTHPGPDDLHRPGRGARRRRAGRAPPPRGRRRATHPRHRRLPAQQGDHRRHDGPVRHPDQRGRLQRPLQRRHRRYQHGDRAVLRGPVAGPEGLCLAARRSPALQR